jgi:hypothetical protein
MKTNIREVEVTYRTENTPISVEEICKEFYGIVEITYLSKTRNIHNKKDVVYVYTLNLETIDIADLIDVQKRLKADSLSLGCGNRGIFYILSY